MEAGAEGLEPLAELVPRTGLGRSKTPSSLASSLIPPRVDQRVPDRGGSGSKDVRVPGTTRAPRVKTRGMPRRTNRYHLSPHPPEHDAPQQAAHTLPPPGHTRHDERRQCRPGEGANAAGQDEQ